eukprot:Gregarina_sp_Poly_1__9993@NODE_664_length_6888_cov_103_167424_g502_i0_p2_GENE_NODE_664_length_6888_cov_103_167424_g502_i0NODE_664_length_6888_cov_103_167424_g502_i0_p2_ORF_typecomplete_len356_score36_71KH_6/PF15985_5/2_5e08Bac_DnaA_C/PF08299_11/0_23_NODE_664_length_6888_cov_103_167424_g502_i052416308
MPWSYGHTKTVNPNRICCCEFFFRFTKPDVSKRVEKINFSLKVMFKTFGECRPSPFIELLQGRASSLLQNTVLMVAGDPVKCGDGVLRGHGIVTGTRMVTDENEDDVMMSEQYLKSTMNGFVRQVNRLLYVEPLHSKYSAEPGDVIIGRITEVSAGRWLLEVGGIQQAVLPLASIALPSGEQRRKTDAEAIDMRRFFIEDDLLSTEVQKVNQDGTVLLHTRSGRYGKLSNGTCVCVPPTLVNRLSQHMVTLPCGVHIVLGKNGFFWVGAPPVLSATATLNFVAALDEPFEKVTPVLRERIARVRNCIVWLSRRFIRMSPQTIGKLYTVSTENSMSITDILNDENETILMQGLLNS